MQETRTREGCQTAILEEEKMARRKYLNGKPPKIVLGGKTYDFRRYPHQAERVADDAMRLYGHPEWAIMVLESQRELWLSEGWWDDIRTRKSNDQFYEVIGELRKRAEKAKKDSPWEDSPWGYSISKARERLGEPIAPIGTWTP
jgi:hypothetical protein